MGFKDISILAYAAGIIDGEGTISLIKEQRKKTPLGYSITLHVQVSNTEEWLCHWLQMQFAGYVSSPYQPKGRAKLIWKWMIKANKAVDFLRLISPYLQLKKHKAELAIQFQEQRGHGQRARTMENKAIAEDFYKTMKELNYRGVVNAN